MVHSTDPSAEIIDGGRARGRPPAEPEPRRQRIIVAATDLFIEKGFVGTTIDLVAQRSGLNKRTIYGLVGDKKQLFHEVCRNVAMNGDLDLSDAFDRASLRDSLIHLGQRLIGNSLSERTIALEKTTIAASRRFPELIDEIVTTTYREANSKVFAFFQQLQDFGMLTMTGKADPGALFFDVVIGQLAHRMALGQSHSLPTAEYLESRVDFFLKGYLGATD